MSGLEPLNENIFEDYEFIPSDVTDRPLTQENGSTLELIVRKPSETPEKIRIEEEHFMRLSKMRTVSINTKLKTVKRKIMSSSSSEAEASDSFYL